MTKFGSGRLEGKLSWMVIAIIGGVIVTVGIIVFFSFAGNSILEMLIGNQAVKAWVQLSAGIQKAETTGGSVLPGWSLDWLDCTYVTSSEYSNPYCGWYYGPGGSPPGHYGKTVIKKLNVIIFIENKNMYNQIRDKLIDKQSLDVLERCKCTSSCNCMCLGSFESSNFDRKEYTNGIPNGKYFRQDNANQDGTWSSDKCAWGTSSFITYDNASTFIETIPKIRLIQCSKIPLPVEINVDNKYKEILAIQHFEGTIYLTREKATGGYFIDLKFTPKERPYWDGSGNPPNGGCAFVDNKVYFS